MNNRTWLDKEYICKAIEGKYLTIEDAEQLVPWLKGLLEENAKLVKALEHYANDSNWSSLAPEMGSDHARHVLSELKGGKDNDPA